MAIRVGVNANEIGRGGLAATEVAHRGGQQIRLAGRFRQRGMHRCQLHRESHRRRWRHIYRRGHGLCLPVALQFSVPRHSAPPGPRIFRLNNTHREAHFIIRRHRLRSVITAGLAGLHCAPHNCRHRSPAPGPEVVHDIACCLRWQRYFFTAPGPHPDTETTAGER